MTEEIPNDRYCIFEVNGEYFAAPAEQISEIRYKPDFAAVPCCTSVLAGLWHQGSEFVPVVRLPFHKSYQPATNPQVLIVPGAFGRWALLVDRIHKIDSIECCQGGTGDTEWSKALMGMSEWDGQSVRVLSLEGLYSSLEGTLKQDWSCQFDVSDQFPSEQAVGAN